MEKLFVVPRGPLEQPPEAKSVEADVFEISGEVKTDLETALHAIAFLLDFIDSVGGADGLRCCADDIRKLEVPR